MRYHVNYLKKKFQKLEVCIKCLVRQIHTKLMLTKEVFTHFRMYKIVEVLYNTIRNFKCLNLNIYYYIFYSYDILIITLKSIDLKNE